MFRSLIVGFGRAGEHLHLHCLRKARKLCMDEGLFSEIVGVVDPKIVSSTYLRDGSIYMFHDLLDVRGFDPLSTVVHICTLPIDHLTTIRKVAELGYTKIIVEKPLAISLRGLEETIQLQERWHLDLLIVANWLSSSLTKSLKDLLDSNKFGHLCQLAIEQHKPRFLRTLRDSGHTTAFDVELPHQVALALYLAGQGIQVIDAACTDMQCGTMIIPYMGTARMTMLHDSGLKSFLFSDLTAQTRKRCVRLSFKNHLVEGCFPAAADVSYSRLRVYDCDHQVLETKLLADDPLTTCFQEYYRYYKRYGHKPVSDLSFNTIVVSAMTQAKVLSGILY